MQGPSQLASLPAGPGSAVFTHIFCLDIVMKVTFVPSSVSLPLLV